MEVEADSPSKIIDTLDPQDHPQPSRPATISTATKEFSSPSSHQPANGSSNCEKMEDVEAVNFQNTKRKNVDKNEKDVISLKKQKVKHTSEKIHEDTTEKKIEDIKYTDLLEHMIPETAKLVAQNGIEYEKNLEEEKRSKDHYEFMKKDSPLYEYYSNCLRHFQNEESLKVFRRNFLKKGLSVDEKDLQNVSNIDERSTHSNSKSLFKLKEVQNLKYEPKFSAAGPKPTTAGPKPTTAGPKSSTAGNNKNDETGKHSTAKSHHNGHNNNGTTTIENVKNISEKSEMRSSDNNDNGSSDTKKESSNSGSNNVSKISSGRKHANDIEKQVNGYDHKPIAPSEWQIGMVAASKDMYGNWIYGEVKEVFSKNLCLRVKEGSKIASCSVRYFRKATTFLAIPKPKKENEKRKHSSRQSQKNLDIISPRIEKWREQLRVGSRVTVFWGEKWYSGRVRAKLGKRVLLKYDEFAESWDEWLPLYSDRIARYSPEFQDKTPPSLPFTDFHAGQELDAKDINNNWFRGEVVEVYQKCVKVHFDGWDDKYDQTIMAPSSFIAPPGRHSDPLFQVKQTDEGMTYDFEAFEKCPEPTRLTCSLCGNFSATFIKRVTDGAFFLQHHCPLSDRKTYELGHDYSVKISSSVKGVQNITFEISELPALSSVHRKTKRHSLHNTRTSSKRHSLSMMSSRRMSSSSRKILIDLDSNEAKRKDDIRKVRMGKISDDDIQIIEPPQKSSSSSKGHHNKLVGDKRWTKKSLNVIKGVVSSSPPSKASRRRQHRKSSDIKSDKSSNIHEKIKVLRKIARIISEHIFYVILGGENTIGASSINNKTSSPQHRNNQSNIIDVELENKLLKLDGLALNAFSELFAQGVNTKSKCLKIEIPPKLTDTIHKSRMISLPLQKIMCLVGDTPEAVEFLKSCKSLQPNGNEEKTTPVSSITSIAVNPLLPSITPSPMTLVSSITSPPATSPPATSPPATSPPPTPSLDSSRIPPPSSIPSPSQTLTTPSTMQTPSIASIESPPAPITPSPPSITPSPPLIVPQEEENSSHPSENGIWKVYPSRYTLRHKHSSSLLNANNTHSSH